MVPCLLVACHVVCVSLGCLTLILPGAEAWELHACRARGRSSCPSPYGRHTRGGLVWSSWSRIRLRVCCCVLSSLLRPPIWMRLSVALAISGQPGQWKRWMPLSLKGLALPVAGIAGRCPGSGLLRAALCLNLYRHRCCRCSPHRWHHPAHSPSFVCGGIQSTCPHLAG
jgi:hypothetical protein